MAVLAVISELDDIG